MKSIFNNLKNGIAPIKKKTSKRFRYLMLWILAVMMVSCNDFLEVDITPEETAPTTVTYNTAECEYWGNLYETGTANFDLWLFNSSDSDVGIRIEGFCALPSSFANFRLDAGTYTLANTGAVRTFLAGRVEDATIYSTYLFDRNNSVWTIITGGTFTVSLTGNTYTITANFTGEDSDSGVEVKDISISFTGTVKFTNKSEEYGGIVESAYTATATPRLLSPPGDNKWAGMIEPVESGNDKWYEITNWGNDDITVYLDDEDGELVIDNYTIVAYNDTYDGYFRIGYIEGGYMTLLPLENHVVKYNPSTGILEFPNTVTDDGKQYEAVVGVAAYNRATGQLESAFTDFYANVKLQLTPVSTIGSTAQRSTSVADALKNTSITQRKSKSATDIKPTNIVVDESLKSKMQKIPLKNLKAIDGAQLK